MRLVNEWSGRAADPARVLPFVMGVERKAEDWQGDPVRVVDRVSPKRLNVAPCRALSRLHKTRGQEANPNPEAIPSAVRSSATIERWNLRQKLRPIQGALQRACGCRPIGPVYVGAGWQRGLVTCKSAHACPVCSARLRLQRASEVHEAIGWWTSDGNGRVGMLTLTVRHSAGFRLKRLRSLVCEAWRRLWTGREGRALRSRFRHFVRALDATWGRNGWHPHIHALIFSDETLTEEWLLAVRQRWVAVVSELAIEATPRDDAIGVHWSPNMSRAEYICKLGLEVSAITSKGAAEGHATPWQIAHLAASEVGAGDLSGPMALLWRDWTRGMKGARNLTWSRKLRKAIAIEEREEPAEEEETTDEHPWVVVLQPKDWSLARQSGLSSNLVLKLSTRGPRSVLACYEALGFWTKRVEQHTAEDGAPELDVWRVFKPSIDQQLKRIGRHDEPRTSQHRQRNGQHGQRIRKRDGQKTACARPIL